MIVEYIAKDGTKSYLVRVGRKPAKAFSEREYGSKKAARSAASTHEGALLAGGKPTRRTFCDTYADRVVEHLASEKLKNGRKRKKSTMATITTSANGFKAKWGPRLVTGIDRGEARDWSLTAPPGHVRFAVQLFNRAVDERLRSDNPFAGLVPTIEGRSNDAPPTVEEWEKLRDGWAVHDKKDSSYAAMGRAFFVFASFSGLRPGEIYALEWDDVDFEEMVIHVRRRLYDGELDLPKSNQVRTVVLLPQARDAILSLPRVARTVFVGKRGGGLTQPKLSVYWSAVKAKAGVDFDLYHATKHRFVHEAFVVRGISANGIAQQMGWSLEAVNDLLKIYGHGDVGWRDEWRHAYGDNVTPLKVVGE